MRVVHTADIHLDRSYAGLGLPPARGNENRVHLRSLLDRLLERTATWPADALVITGDLFELERVTRGTINYLQEAFANIAPVTVVLCPGRADPCEPGSPYVTEPWPDNVHLFRRMQWEALALADVPLSIHGFGWETHDHNGKLPAPPSISDDSRMHMAFGYGLAADVLLGAPLEPARLDAGTVLPAGLGYLGLGGFHATRMVEASSEMPVWFAGAPEGHSFDEMGPHQYLEISVDTAIGGPCDWQATVQPQTISAGRFQRITVDCTGLTSGQDLMDAVRREWGDAGPERYVCLTLEGSLIRPVYEELDGIRDALAEEVRYLQWHDTCLVAEDYAALATEHTSLGAFVARINAEIDDAPTHALRLQRQRSRDLGLCAYRDTTLPVRGIPGDYR